MKVIADYREKGSGIIDRLNNEKFDIIVKKVTFGDYIINNFTTVERKTANDFLISIIDGRLFKQAANLKKNCMNPIFVVEGNPYKTELDVDSRAIKGALISIQTIWYIPILHSRSIEDTVDIFNIIARQEKINTDVLNLRGGYRPKRLVSKKLYLLQGLPQIGPMLAKRLLKHFKSVSRIMNASVEELREVDGIGNVAAYQIRKILDSETILD